MSRRFKGNNAFVLASGARAASNLTHGVSCASRDCNVFDPNVAKTHEGRWHCEACGGYNNIARANAKDDKFANGIPGAERRARFARFRAKKKAANTHTAHIPSFLDRKPVERRQVAVAPVAPKPSERERALAALGLSEADLAAFVGA
tara:strand:- start:531 stop:971 length:441 start_codon:yes stop_codon:yes gene_type:complete